jgi:transglutaminase-like putative cysteine protease
MHWKAHVLLTLLVLALSFHAATAAAADWDPITETEKAMKSNPLDPGSGAVVLFKRGRIDVTERTSLFYQTRVQSYVRIKIFNDAGRDAGNVSIESFKTVRVSKIEGRTILPSGEIIPLDASKVFTGKSYQAGKSFAFLETSFTFPSVVPGAIIEYQLEEMEDGLYPAPWIFDTPDTGTIDSSLEVTIAPRLAMNQFPLDTTANKIAIKQSDTVKGSHVSFSVKNLHPIQREPFSLPFRDLATMILFTPTQLAFGNDVYPLITKWDDVGATVTREFDDMQKSEKAARDKAKELAEKASDPRQKAEAIYKYIQQNIISSNLIGVNLGRTADEVINSKRGDPDEINALLVIMLKEVKVDAEMVLVATQNWQAMIRGFPNFSQFSRIVTRINFKGGASMFADPADAGAPFGDLPWFDRGVMGLAVKGTKVQEAPILPGTAEDNTSATRVTVQVRKDWTTEGDVQTEFKGAEAIEYRNDLLEESPENAEKQLTDYFGYGHSDAEISQIVHPEFRDTSQPFVLKAHFREKLTNESGPGELLLNPWLDDQYERPLFKATARHSAVRFNNLEKRVSTSVWQLAPEIKVEQLPKDVKAENDLGGFSHSCVQNAGTVTCTRTFYLKKTLLMTTVEYLNAKKFFDEIAKNDQEVIVLRGQ